MPSTPFVGPSQTVDPDQMPQNVASDQGLHCLLSGNSFLNRIKMKKYPKIGNRLVQLIWMDELTTHMG